MARESHDIPHSMRRVYRLFERWRSAHTARLPIPERLWAAAVELAREQGVSPTAQALHLEYGKLEAADGRIRESGGEVRGGEGPGSGAAPRTAHRAAGVSGNDDIPSGGSVGVRDRVGRAARQDAHPVERDDSAGPGWAQPGLVGVEVIQIAPQMRILVAIESVDGRKGIDSLARLCQEKLEEDPFSGCLFVFRSRRGTSIRILTYDGQGFWLAQKRLSKGRFVWWPSGKEPTRRLQAHQVQVLLAAGNPEVAAAPVWRGVGT